MKRSRHPGKAPWLVGVVLALTGCGGSGGSVGGDGIGSAGGTVTEPWTGYCTGTFTEDTPINDAFGDLVFTARAGAQFLLSDFDDSFGGRAEFLYLSNVGPDSFEVEARTDGTWPFTSNCTIGQGVPYYAVFNDVSVFAEQELTTKICDLSAGSVLPAGSSGRGYSFVGSKGESAIYNVILGPFGEQCGGHADGYISVPHTTSFGSTTWLVPIVGIIGPE